MSKPSIAEQYRVFLEQIWDRPQETPQDVWIYQKALGSKFVEFVGLTEKLMRVFADRIKNLEAQLGIGPAQQNAPATTPSNGKPVQGAPGGMVRLDGNKEPMSAEDQAAEEAADMALYGAIDQSRYVPRGATSTALPPLAAPPPPPPEAEVVPQASPNGQS